MNYAEMAAQEKVIYCGGCDPALNPFTNKIEGFDHLRGGANSSRGVVHWTNRRVNRIGLRRFLMLVAAIKYSHNRGQPRWQQVYEQNTFAYHRALEQYHVRLSKRWSLTDRARVRYWMGREKVLSDPQHAAAARWATERE